MAKDVTITGFGDTTYDGGAIISPVNGNPMVSQFVQQNDGITLTRPDG
ncbi:hypothetical protein [Flexivirga alba]|uniref:Uncharacterized protein n=1 Tax=Flexivirga alba TaxID=702742 RepID=A0ABW2AFW4_9MICO